MVEQLKLKASLYSDDGGKTWLVGTVFYLTQGEHYATKEFLDSSEARTWVFRRLPILIKDLETIYEEKETGR